MLQYYHPTIRLVLCCHYEYISLRLRKCEVSFSFQTCDEEYLDRRDRAEYDLRIIVWLIKEMIKLQNKMIHYG